MSPPRIKTASALLKGEGMARVYETDILEWSELQAAALAARDVDALDWDNLAEEIEDVGSNQFHSVQSHIVQALLHQLKVIAWPNLPYVDGWEAEVRQERGHIRRRFANSMRRKINMDELYRDALDALPATQDRVPAGPEPKECPVTLDDLLAPPAVVEES